MSSKNTLFLTEDNEHSFLDCSQPNYENKKFIGDTLVLEMSKENIEILANDSDDLIIEIKAGSELYNLMLMMRN
jgi:hypothetical protein